MSNSQVELQVTGRTSTLLSPEALRFVEELERRFGDRRRELLEARKGKTSWDFLPETAGVRAGAWRVAPVPEVLLDRRVEITGPAEPKMIINALNCGANVFMADLEDSLSPTWEGVIGGQEALYQAVRHALTFQSPEGKAYRLNEKIALLFVRPRGWALEEAHVRYQGRPMSGSLFDFGLFFFHNAGELREKGSGPYFYLPKMESHKEARYWNNVFNFAQDYLNLPRGTIRATVLIETIMAAYEMEEILFELREHAAGLNAGRWDYIFSFIKRFRAHGEKVLPDRSQVTMDVDFMKAYCLRLVEVCHRRGAHAMGGMSAFIPNKEKPEITAQALAKVQKDKAREVSQGFDGTWVAHPGLVPLAMEIFNARMPTPNQLTRLREDVKVSAGDLLRVPTGTITEQGLRVNVNVGLRYLEAWLRGNGCVPIFNLMEDAATCEISRTQVWQWIRHPGGVLADGRKVTVPLFRQVMGEELDRIRGDLGAAVFDGGRFDVARQIFDAVSTSDEFVEFLTLPAYEHLP